MSADTQVDAEEITNPAEPETATQMTEETEAGPGTQKDTDDKPAEQPKKADTGPEIDLGGTDGASTDAPKGKKPKDTLADPVTITKVTNVFYAGVDAPGGTFGINDGGAGRRAGGRRRVTGKMSDTDVEAAVRRYAEPACFEDAIANLRSGRILVVEGVPGTGRRAGALNLLRQVTLSTLVVLSPTYSLRELAEREYDEGCGYLILDRIRDRDRERADLEFTWSNVKDQVTEAKAYLVITSSFVGSAATDSVPHVSWTAPPTGEILRAQLDGVENLEEKLRELLALLPEACSLASLVAIARVIRDEGMTPVEAMKKVDENAGRRVREWFAGKPDLREVMAATALCFLDGTDLRTFEGLLQQLSTVMASHLDGKKAKTAVLKRDADLFHDRETLLLGNGLLDVRDVPWRAGTIRNVVFKDDAYRHHVLDHLWQTRSKHFWDPVREWLAGAIAVAGDDVAVAGGLAWLACASIDEVERSYLDPWSAGLIGLSGQVTSAYVLWMMCHREGLAPVALQTAVRWAGDRDLDRKWTAALAFGGELGVYYPADAVNRLWQLASQNDELWQVSCAALACLFVILRDDEAGDPNIVLNLLDIKMKTFGVGSGRGDAKRPMPAKQLIRLQALTMSACLSVFAADSFRTGRPAVFEYLVKEPGRIAAIARVWAGVIIYRPLRWRAFKELRRGLHALRDIDSKQATATARAFGSALSEALPPSERRPFKEEFMQVDERLRKGEKKAPAEVLLACLDAIAVKTHPGGVI